MSIIETITDVDNTFLSRRELTCNFAGLGGKLKSLEAADMVTKEFKLDGKVVIPMRLKTHVGQSHVTGTFYVYEDEGLAKKHEIKIKRHEQIMSSDISNVPTELPALDGFGPKGNKYRSTQEYIVHDSVIERAALLTSIIYACSEKHGS